MSADALRRATSSMPSLRSMPVTVAGRSERASSRARSPVPVATSSMSAWGPEASMRTALRTPQPVDAEGHHPVHEVVGGSYGVEHVAHLLCLASRVASVGVDALGFTSIRVCYLRASSQAVTDFSMREAMSAVSASRSNFSPVMCSYSSM